MKKRILSFVLMLSMLISLFTVFATATSAASGDDSTPSPKSSGAGASYLDLYVKEGLVALFDGFGLSASSDAATEWKAVDLSGKEGYDAYVDPSTYTTAFSYAADNVGGTKNADASRVKWQFANGYVSLVASGNASGTADAFFNVSALGEKLGTEWSVQEVFAMDGTISRDAKFTATYVDNGNGTYTISNYDALGKDHQAWMVGAYGVFAPNVVHLIKHQIMIDVYLCNQYYNPAALKSVGQVYFNSEYYGVISADKVFVADGKTRVPAEYSYVGVNKAGIFERTISRLGDATAVEGGFAVSFVTDYQFAPTTKYGNAQGSLSANFTVPDKATADSTAFRILADEAARVYSVRFYNKALNSAERSQNHFADLVAFYGLDNATLAKVLAYDRYQMKALYAATDTIEIARSGKDTAPGSEYMLLKKALTDAIALAEKSKREEAKEYIYDYVSDGLVAIFDAFSAKSTDGETSVWKPVDLYGVEGYEDYIDPLTYSYNFLNSWKFVDGGVMPVAKSGALNLDSLGALLGTTYTVQEIQSYPNLLVPKVENGVFVNNDQYVSVGNYNSGAIGALLYGDLNSPNIKPNASGYGLTLHNVLFGQICFGTPSSYEYLDHVYYITDAYGATTFKNVVDKNGVSYDNVLVGNGPFTVERTFFRLGVTETVEAGVTSYASHYKVYYQSLPMFRYAAGSNNTASYDITKYPDNQAVHYSTKLTVAGGGATQHSIRIYNRELSRAELDHNHMIDLAITSGASLASYEALAAEAKALVASLMGSVSLFSSKAAVEAKIEEYKNFSAGNEGGSGAGLYVSKGLTVLLAAYTGFSTPYVVQGESSVLWANGMAEGSFATLMGTGWRKNATGGFTIVKTINDYSDSGSPNRPKENYGLELGTEMLPEGNFTVELVANPVGISRADGSRYIDSKTTYGTYVNAGFAIGPLRCLQFGSYRPAGKDGQMHRRWYYSTTTEPYLKDGSSLIKVIDKYWEGLEVDEIVNLTVTLEVGANVNKYAITHNGSASMGLVINASEVISNEKAPMFRLMNGVAGTIFSARVYDRVLSKDELAQNHMADLVYYYGIDAGLVVDVLNASGGTLSSLSQAFADLDFSIDKNKAQEIFNKRLTAVWLTYNGFAIKGNLTDGLRYYFTVNAPAIAAVSSTGVSVEIGTIVNVGKDALPTLNGYGYDYKIVAFDSVMGKVSDLYINEDTYAVTVNYTAVGKDILNTSIKVLGYVKLVDDNGNASVYYTSIEDGMPQSLFESYYLMDEEENQKVIENNDLYNYVSAKIAASYSDAFIYLDAAAVAGGNGTKEAPFNNFEEAFAKCKETLRALTTPTNLTLEMKDGRYSILNTQELLAADKPYTYSYFTVKGENGGAVLTTTVDIDAKKFELTGDNIYTYQFEADENGNYPEFRILYVNDAIATIATNGSDKAANKENLFMTAFDRRFDGVGQLAKDLSTLPNYDFNFYPESYEGREDLKEEFAFHRDQYIAFNEVMAKLKPLTDELAAGKKVSDTLKPLTYEGMTPAYTGGSEMYQKAFRIFYLKLMGAADLIIRVNSRNLINTAIQNLAPSSVGVTLNNFNGNEADFALYTEGFNEAKNSVLSTKNKYALYTAFTAEARDVNYTVHMGKYYMPLDMVGDLSDLVTSGDALMKEKTAKDLEATLQAYKLAEAVYNLQKKTSDAFTAATSELKAMKDLVNDSFAAMLDGRIAATTTLVETLTAELEALEDEEDILAKTYELLYASTLLASYENVKAKLADGAVSAIDAAITANDEALRQSNITAAGYEAALVEAQTAYTNAQQLYNDVHDEYLWIRNALRPYGIELHHTAQWNYNILHLGGVDYADYVEVINEDGEVEKHVAVYQAKTGFQINDGYLTSDRYVHMKNAYAYLDENNEYFYDRANGKLYLYSDTPVSGFDVEYATLDWMFTLWGVNKLNFENVQFTGTDDYWLTENDYLGGLGGMSPYVTLYGTTGFQDRSALYFNDCSEVRVTGCRFYDLACEGINAAGWNTDFYYANNVFENIGSSALRMGTHNPILSDSTGGSWFEGETGARNVTVINNYFHNIATEYNTPALMITKLDQGVIKNNTIIDCTYTAISLGWDFDYDYKNFDYDNRVNLRNVDVSYNYISGFMTEMGDGGAIYVPLPNQKTSVTDFYINSMHHNYIMFSKNTGDGTGKMVVGIYFDISSSNWYCFENIVAEQSYGAHKDETDLDAYGVSEEEAESKRLSRQGSDYIYLQHIDTQECHNLFVKDNFIINVRATKEDAQFYEVYQNFFDVKDAVKGRNLQEEGTVYIVGVKSIPNYVKGLIAKAGSEGHRGDIALLQSNNY